MAIPIKCPGCQAAFEVPDTLAGKTIRCTSCKTQLTVSAAAPAVAGAGEKKPFGSAGSKPVAAPLPLDDDDVPVAKTAPPVPVAKTAPVKPAAKPVVELDEDDDDKRKPARSTAATKVVKPAAKRRDDGDEDDEDDDRPAKRKGKKPAKSGGSNGMLLLIAGGGAGLLAIVGVVVWLLMDSGDKKETAGGGSSSSSSGTTATMSPGGPGGMTMPAGSSMSPPAGGGAAGPSSMSGPGALTPPMGGSAAGPPGGMTMPGSPGMPGGPTGGWQTFRGDGFTVDMPGTPTSPGIPPVPGGGAVKAYALELPDKKGGFIVMAMGLPAVGQKLSDRQILDVILDQMTNNKGGGGPLGSFGKLGSGANSPKVRNKRDAIVDGYPAADLDLDGPQGGALVARLVAAKGKIYMLFAGHESNSGFSADAQRFLNSFKLGGGELALGPPGGPGGAMTPPNPMGPGGAMTPPNPMGPTGPGSLAMPPSPMGPGGPGLPGGPNPAFPMGPGGPNPGFPAGPGGPNPAFPMGPGGEARTGRNGAPPGTIIRPRMEAKIKPFHAIAFDAAKNEVYTISPRQDTKSARVFGTLYRYSYPEFKSKGEFNIPHFASRAVIDTNRGLLYTATTGTVGAASDVFHKPFDRAAVYGDVAVFDLDPIRSGKIASGEDLKTTRSFGARGTIRGLELSEDGKSLYAVVSRTENGRSKSHVMEYDTTDGAEKKLVREKDLADFHVWDTRKSADGKQLLLMEHPTAVKRDNLRVQVFDLATWKPARSVSIPGGTSDVAAHSSGMMVAASTTPNAPPQAAKLIAVTKDGDAQDVAVPTYHLAHNFYAQFTPNGKYLFATSHGENIPTGHGPTGGVAGGAGGAGGGNFPGGGQNFPNGGQNFPGGGRNFPGGGRNFPNGGMNGPNGGMNVPNGGMNGPNGGMNGPGGGNGHFPDFGVDVYEKADGDTGGGLKHVASFRFVLGAGYAVGVGGYFHISPDSEFVVFQNGAVTSVQKATVNAPNADTIPDVEGGAFGGGQPNLQGQPGGYQAQPGGPGVGPGMNPPPGGIGIPPGQPGNPMLPPPGGGLPGNPMQPMPGGGLPANPMQPIPGGGLPAGPMQPPGGLPGNPMQPMPGGAGPAGPMPLQPGK